ncbi:hypothetical protein SL1157_1580 [Ruegeria lacuscaerulensis ITI-1157]|nr:hypothetical protein SL1157_1580 [Ruegeria lacuscaerulensis ITI-1157]
MAGMRPQSARPAFSCPSWLEGIPSFPPQTCFAGFEALREDTIRNARQEHAEHRKTAQAASPANYWLKDP